MIKPSKARIVPKIDVTDGSERFHAQFRRPGIVGFLQKWVHPTHLFYNTFIDFLIMGDHRLDRSVRLGYFRDIPYSKEPGNFLVQSYAGFPTYEMAEKFCHDYRRSEEEAIELRESRKDIIAERKRIEKLAVKTEKRLRREAKAYSRKNTKRIF